MSLEDSMKALAESNLKLAAAQEHYAGVIEKFGSLVVASAGDAAPAAAAASTKADAAPATTGKGKGKGGKGKAEPAAETKTDDAGFGDDDGFGGDDAGGEGEAEGPEKLTGDQVKAKLLEVRDAYGDKAPALKIINDLGYNAIPDVKAADYQKVWAACEKAIAAAP